MWISKKAFNRIIAERVEEQVRAEHEREAFYQFRHEIEERMHRLETQVNKNTQDIQNNYHYIAPPSYTPKAKKVKI